VLTVLTSSYGVQRKAEADNFAEEAKGFSSAPRSSPVGKGFIIVAIIALLKFSHRYYQSTNNKYLVLRFIFIFIFTLNKMPFSSIQITTTTPTPTMQGRRSRRLSSEEATRIIRIARRKSSDGCASSNKDRNLRVFLGHAHIAETLKHEFIDYFHYHSSSSSSPAQAPCQRPQPVRQWADSFAEQRVTTEDEAVAFEDDGEEDFESLSLVRTPSRSAQPPRSPV